MTERSALEILVAQLNEEVVLAGNEVRSELYELIHAGADDSKVAGALEALCDRVVKRWWLTRMLQTPQKQVSTEESQARGAQRAQMAAACTAIIQSKSGAIDTTSLQMVALAQASELNAIWRVLIESALVTPVSRIDYMDAAMHEQFQRTQAFGQKILLATGDVQGLRGN